MNSLLVVYDVETTGKDPELGDDIAQLASLIHVEGTDEVFETNSYADPGKPMPEEASAVNHITDDMLIGQPSAREVTQAWWADVVALAVELQRPIVLAGHNTQFDRRFISKHLDNLPELQICSFRLATRVLPTADNHKLEYLYKEKLQLQGRGELQAHDALADVIMSFDLIRLWQQTRNYTALAEWLHRPVELPTIPLGKYKGTPFVELRYGYLKWLRDTEDMNPDVRLSARLAIERRYAA
jgi:DNA polymerase III epsilon subunit-like protein